MHNIFPSTTFFAMLSYQRITPLGFDGLHSLDSIKHPTNRCLQVIFVKASCLDMPLLSISSFLIVLVIYWNLSKPQKEGSSILIVKEKGKKWIKEKRVLISVRIVTNISVKKVLTSVSSSNTTKLELEHEIFS